MRSSLHSRTSPGRKPTPLLLLLLLLSFLLLSTLPSPAYAQKLDNTFVVKTGKLSLYFTSLTFDIQLPQDATLDGTPIGSASLDIAELSQGTKVCDSQVFDDTNCIYLPNVVQSLRGAFNLTCGGVTYDTNLPPIVQITSSTVLWPGPAQTDPLHSMFSALGRDPNQADLDHHRFSTPVNNHLTLVFMQFANSPLGKDSFLGKPVDAFSSCVVSVDGRNANLRYADGSYIHETFSGFHQRHPHCNYDLFSLIGDELARTQNTMLNATSWKALSQGRYLVSSLTASDVWVGCASLATSFTKHSPVAAQSKHTTACFATYGTADFAKDPCCNATLKWSMCCAPRDIQTTVYNHRLADNVDKCVDLLCLIPFRSKATIQDFVRSSNQIEDANTGCAAVAQQQVNPELYKTLLAFSDQCHDLISGNDVFGPHCVDDDDCYTTCDIERNRCVVPQGVDAVPVYTRCYIERMDPRVKRALLIDWGLGTRATDQQFQAEFAERVLAEDCIGPESAPYKFRITTEKADKNCTSNCNLIKVYHEANRTGCLAVLGCNSGACSSVDKDCKATCQRKINQHPHFCGYCTRSGQRCLEMSDWPGCEIASSPTYSQCTAAAAKNPNIYYDTMTYRCMANYTQEQCFANDARRCNIYERRYDSLGRPIIYCRGECVAPGVTSYKQCCSPCCCPDSSSVPRNQSTCDTNSTISQCVCKSKPECCTGPWTFACAQAVNTLGCGQGTCVFPSVKGLVRFWANHTQRCIVNVDVDQQCTRVLGYKYIYGNRWHEGRYTNESQCRTGYCKDGLNKYEAECDRTQLCTKPCQSCASTQYFSACWTANELLCKTNLQVSSNRFYGLRLPLKNGTTIYTCYNLQLPRNECLAIDSSMHWQTCHDMDYNQCAACAADPNKCPEYMRYFGCSWQNSALCIDEATCLSRGGDCEDGKMHPNATSPGACYRPHDLDPNTGSPECPAHLYQALLGCVDTGVLTEAACIARGAPYRWAYRAYNKSSCERLGSGCKLPQFANPSVPLADQTARCKDCGGSVDQLYNWEAGQWVRGEMRPLDWIPRAWNSVNQWNNTINHTLLNELVSKAVAHSFATSFETESLCSSSRLYDTLLKLSCDCSGGHDAASRRCYGTNALVPVGVIKACYGISVAQRTGPVEIITNTYTIQRNVDCTDIFVSVISASNFAVTNTEYLSSGLLPSFSQAYNPYGVIKNQYGTVVGQLDSDGFQLKFSVPLNQSLTVCVARRSDINVDATTFPVLDIAQASNNFATFTPLSVKVDTTSRPGQFCMDVHESGNTYFVVNRIQNWRTARNVHSSVFSELDIVSLYVTAALYYLVALAAVGKLLFMCNTSRPEENRLQKTFHLLCFAFCMCRGFYMTFLPLVDAENVSEFALYILFEFSTFLLFSTYNCLVFFWAETLHFARGGFSTSQNSKMAVMGRLSKVSWTANIVMYTIWIIMVALFHTIPSGQEDIKRAYSIFVASMSLVLALAYVVYGKRLHMLSSSMLVNTQSNVRRRTNKITVIAMICAVSFLAHCVFNLLTTLLGQFLSPFYALLIYIITEIIPCCILLVILRSQVTRKNTQFLKLYKRMGGGFQSGTMGSRSASVAEGDSLSYKRMDDED